jgi:hypothetical protein
MESKQTAVEWLIDKVEDHFCLLPVDLIEQAQEMEKKQKYQAQRESYDEGWLEATQYIFKKYKEQEDGNL